MAFFTSQGVRLYYEIHGEGQPLLLVSGLGGGAWSWYGQVPYFSRYYRTIVFDNRGAGRSDAPPPPYTMKQLAEDALGLLDHLGVDSAFVVGVSMGGMIAQELALLAPERIEALVLGCTHCGGDLHISPPPPVIALLLNNEGLSQEQILRKNLPLFFSESFLKERSDLIEAYCRAQLSAPPQPEHAFQAQLFAIHHFDCSDRLPSIRMPVLIVTGDRDVLIPPENSVRMAEHIPHAELVKLPGTGHAIHAECCDAFNTMVHDFFKRHEAESTFQGTL